LGQRLPPAENAFILVGGLFVAAGLLALYYLRVMPPTPWWVVWVCWAVLFCIAMIGMHFLDGYLAHREATQAERQRR
jgi:cobalamin synthase